MEAGRGSVSTGRRTRVPTRSTHTAYSRRARRRRDALRREAGAWAMRTQRSQGQQAVWLRRADARGTGSQPRMPET